MPSNNLILCCPLLLPSIFPSIRVFSSESVLCMRWPEYWGFSFSISPSSEYSGLISFRMNWLDHLAFQGTLKSLLQHHTSKVSIFWHLPFFMVQLSHPYMTTGKTIALTSWTFVLHLCVLPLHPSHLPNFCQPLTFLLSAWFCPFQNVIPWNHIVCSLQICCFHLVICICFFHVFSKLDGSFLFSIEIIFHYLGLSQFIYSPPEGHVGCIQVLAIMNKTSVNICVQVFMWI